MDRAFARPTSHWLALLLGAIGLVACSTQPAGPSAPARAAVPIAPPPVVAEAPAAPLLPPVQPYGEAVAARFPEPAVSYRTPAFEPGRTAFTSNAELQTALHALARDGAAGVQLLNLGASQAGVPLEALLFTRNADASPAALLQSGRPTVLLTGQQHGDEPAGSEALLVLAQQLARGPLQGLLDRINVLVLPRANPDGAQNQQHDAANGIDIDRDHLLLRTTEAQAQARLLRDYQPQVVVDAREYAVTDRYLQKFGALQRADVLLQYATTANLPPFVTKASEEWFRQPLLKRLEQQQLSSQWSFTTSADAADKKLSMGSTRPDAGRNVRGLTNAVSLQIETRGGGLGRLHLKRRVHTQVTALTSVLQSTADRAPDLLKLRQYVDADVSAQACQGQVAVDARPTPVEYTVRMLDPATGADKALTVAWDSSLVLTEQRTRSRPCGYWLAADEGDAVAHLRSLGVRVEKVAAVGVVQGETYSELGQEPGAEGDAGGARQLRVQVASALLDAPVGSYYVPLSQPLANLVVAALEPDMPGSYASHRLISAVNKEARITSLPGMKLVVMP